jgi:hypothetical protein
MKVTFVVYDHMTNSLNLVKGEVKGNKPSEEDWDQAAEDAKRKMAEKVEKGLWYNYSISVVLKGWVDFEERTPVGLR